MERILVVDDERLNINVLNELLKSKYKVMAAINGEQALKAASSKNPPDLILLDIMMPEMDGYEVCKILKADDQTKNIPIIFVTAMGQESDETKGLELGAADYLTKPISPVILEARVQTQIKLQRSRKVLIAQKLKIEEQNDEILKEKGKSDELLRNILPEEIADELKEKGRADVKTFDKASILFTDFVGFTKAVSKMSSHELVAELNVCFEAFDHICEKYHVEKIKTIGDAYMAVGGLPLPTKDSVENTVLAALEMQEFIVNRKEENSEQAFEMRAGIHTGKVVAGIVGVKKFQYDIWGDTVNIASRFESNGEPGSVNISQSTYQELKSNPSFTFESRGLIMAKGKGELEMYFVSKT